LQGTVDGKIYLPSVLNFHVKQQIQLIDTVQPEMALQIKRIIGLDASDVDDFPHIEVGPLGESITARTNVSAYGVTSVVFAPEQSRPAIPLQELDRATYNDEPAVAKRRLIQRPFLFSELRSPF
jgi:hypothetical protein